MIYIALLGACYNGHPEVVNTLCNYKADLDIKNEYGVTALILACHKGHIECVTLLCTHGADITIKDREGSTALIIATRKGHLDCVTTLLPYMNVQQMNVTNSFSKCAYDYATTDEMKSLYMRHFNSILYSNKQHLTNTLEANISGNSSNNSNKLMKSTDVILNSSSSSIDTIIPTTGVSSCLSKDINKDKNNNVNNDIDANNNNNNNDEENQNKKRKLISSDPCS